MPAAEKNITRSVPEFVSYVTKTNNVGNTTLTVNPARVATKIGGLKKDTVTGITRSDAGHELLIKASNIIVKDQYGDDMSASDIGTNYQLKVKVDEKSGVFSTCGAIKSGSITSPTTTAVTYNKADLATPDTKNIIKAIATSTAIDSGSVDIEISLLKLKDGSTTEYVDVDGSKYEFKISAVNTSDVRDVMIEDIKLRE
ncbi:hypothetical protein HMPREF1497_2234, partial [Fusobacterium sp. CM21]